jgi:hypothetical protein
LIFGMRDDGVVRNVLRKQQVVQQQREFRKQGLQDGFMGRAIFFEIPFVDL